MFVHVLVHFLTAMSALPLSFESSLHSLDTNPLRDVRSANIFSKSDVSLSVLTVFFRKKF